MIAASDVEEMGSCHEGPEALAVINAKRKWNAVAPQYPNEVVVAADTVVIMIVMLAVEIVAVAAAVGALGVSAATAMAAAVPPDVTVAAAAVRVALALMAEVPQVRQVALV